MAVLARLVPHGHAWHRATMRAAAETRTLALDRMLDRLYAGGRPRVWSLIVTVFGDAIAPRGGSVPLTVLQEVLSQLRVEPGAVRTALSRLVADGWLAREKDGRQSIYHLGKARLNAVEAASRRIYAGSEPRWEGEWTIAATATPAEADRLRTLAFTPHAGAWIRPETSRSEKAGQALDGLLAVRGRAVALPNMTLADWAATLWQLDPLAADYRALGSVLEETLADLANSSPPSPLDALAIRTLANHEWRKIVLRDPALPVDLLPFDWAGRDARQAMARLFDRLADPSEAWLDAAGLPKLADEAAFARRYGRDQSSR